MKPEQRVFLQVKKYLDSLKAHGFPVWYYRTHGGGRTKRGLPDLCVVWCGLAVFIELKAAGGEATPIQKHRLAEIKRAGGSAIIACSVADVRDELSRLRPDFAHAL